MPFEDKTLLCLKCTAEFEFPAQEQEDLATRGITAEPQRCPACREAYRESRRLGPPPQRSSTADRATSSIAVSPPVARPTYPATCVACGRPTRVPFKPAEGRAVYCRDCHHLRRQAAADRG